jgi:hypothetical protein
LIGVTGLNRRAWKVSEVAINGSFLLTCPTEKEADEFVMTLRKMFCIND